ncbi:MAG: class I SAM-dependent methyltransferase [Candidatus Vogelbacteria bacterium]|nr:class I SAM-dependent methyltransferase [Candidatus Vogelbacteria bacterium]
MADRDTRTGEIFEYSVCTNCGVIFQSLRPQKENIGKYYLDSYEPFLGRRNMIVDMFVAWRTGREARMIRKYLPGARDALEVGASWGRYILQLRDFFGFRIQGVELNKKMCELGRSKGIQMHEGTLEDAHLPDESLDVIIMSHVIEHLYDPRGTMREVFRILRPGGIVIIKTPNSDTLERRAFGANWHPYEAPRHTVIFSGRNLGALLVETGFAVKRVSFDATPNNIILSLRNRFEAKFFRLDNYLTLALLTPISFLLSVFKTSGRVNIIGQKP